MSATTALGALVSATAYFTPAPASVTMPYPTKQR